jgi:1-acyl-sn-glycerol-3-phosphate acyltransferase
MVSSSQAETKTYSIKNQGWYRIVRGIVLLLVRLLTRMQVLGREHVPDKGPCLFVTNHLHLLDTPLIAAALPHRVYVFAGEKWAKHLLLGPLFRSLDAIFVHRGEVDRDALRKALVVLAGGGMLGLAPEGTRSQTGGLQRGRSGAAYLALRAGVPVVPLTVTGGAEVFRALRRLRRARVRVVIGPEFQPPVLAADQRPSSVQVRALTDDIMYRLAALLPPEHRGEYSDLIEKRPDLLTLYSSVVEPPPKGR